MKIVLDMLAVSPAVKDWQEDLTGSTTRLSYVQTTVRYMPRYPTYSISRILGYMTGIQGCIFYTK